jgi:hypothetical protein
VLNLTTGWYARLQHYLMLKGIIRLPLCWYEVSFSELISSSLKCEILTIKLPSKNVWRGFDVKHPHPTSIYVNFDKKDCDSSELSTHLYTRMYSSHAYSMFLTRFRSLSEILTALVRSTTLNLPSLTENFIMENNMHKIQGGRDRRLASSRRSQT